jgi:hypothetical protein
LAYPYKQKEENFEQATSDKNVMLLQTSWGTHWEQQKPRKNISLTQPHPPQKKKNPTTWIYVSMLHELNLSFIPFFVCHQF